MNIKFIELCEEEIGKGNRPNSHFNSSGWKILVRRFNEVTGKNYVYKQLRNHWDSMKKDWILFKKLMHQETGIGWDPLTNSIEASDEWWARKLRENGDYNKFRNKDLSLIWFRYDKLFSDVAATGERARAPNQRTQNEIDNDGELFKNNGEFNEVEEHVEIDDIDDNDYIGVDEYNTNPEMKEEDDNAKEIVFPSFSTLKRKSIGESHKVKKKVSGAASLKEDIHSLLQFMEKKSSTTSTLSIEITIATALKMLNNLSGIPSLSELWNYASNLMSKKDMREIFANQPSDEARLSWLEYNFNKYKKNR
ncbi:PREDICTED: uncharacterized protein LOC105966383 [Erythranthe guttata]|uniref:uncharacterized protein LOC105966383 n=1 Tax=Erythranthe guttata TaxID=4155 RepID=UPI00064DA102|nr:PREDICTED: uncharacterized protein LOC105966383 [Erythranthe guttata]|eukprot:XP_012846397.1 PREDICTED: uncharacterized protein LOC105966383 [Erythranthe guttata]